MNFSEIPCIFTSVNTGWGSCTASPGRLVYTMAVPKGTRIELTDAQPEAFEEYLIALLTHDDPAQRGYLLGSFITTEDNSSDTVTESFDGGVELSLYDGAYIWRRRMVEGGLCGHAAMQKFNKQQDRFDFFDIFQSTDGTYKYDFFGTEKQNATTLEPEMSGVRYDDIFTPKFGIATGTTGTNHWMRTVMADVDQYNKRRAFIKTNIAIEDLPRIQDIKITAVKQATGVFDVTAIMGCGGLNAADLYAILADPDAWEAESNLGADVTITGVTIVAKKFRLALDTADADYTAGTTFIFRLKAISVTSAAPFNVKYVESNTTLPVAK